MPAVGERAAVRAGSTGEYLRAEAAGPTTVGRCGVNEAPTRFPPATEMGPLIDNYHGGARHGSWPLPL